MQKASVPRLLHIALSFLVPVKELTLGVLGGGSGLRWKRQGCHPPSPPPSAPAPRRVPGRQGLRRASGAGHLPGRWFQRVEVKEADRRWQPVLVTAWNPGRALEFCPTAGESNPFFNRFLLAESDSRGCEPPTSHTWVLKPSVKGTSKVSVVAENTCHLSVTERRCFSERNIPAVCVPFSSGHWLVFHKGNAGDIL